MLFFSELQHTHIFMIACIVTNNHTMWFNKLARVAVRTFRHFKKGSQERKEPEERESREKQTQKRSHDKAGKRVKEEMNKQDCERDNGGSQNLLSVSTQEIKKDH